MPRRQFLPASDARLKVSSPSRPARRWRFRVITAPTPAFAPSGGMSPPICMTRRAPPMACNGRCFVPRRNPVPRERVGPVRSSHGPCGGNQRERTSLCGDSCAWRRRAGRRRCGAFSRLYRQLGDDGAGRGISRLLLSAAAGQFRYRLQLTSDKEPVAQGDKGYSRKSERGQASYYFSQPFYSVEGELVMRGAPVKVSARLDGPGVEQPVPRTDQKGWDCVFPCI